MTRYVSASPAWEMNRFDPVIRYPPPFARSARVRREAASEPLEASDSPYAPRCSPANSAGRYRSFRASDPNWWMPKAHRWWTDSPTPSDRKARATSSSTHRYRRYDCPPPPNRSS